MEMVPEQLQLMTHLAKEWTTKLSSFFLKSNKSINLNYLKCIPDS